MTKFLPSYVGSKAYWVDYLKPHIGGTNIAELFCGSSVISANLASRAYLNDLDPMIYRIMSQYSQLEELEVFTKDDYFNFRKSAGWWKYTFYFQKMSFSGVFRYSKNGYNVPIKPNISEVRILDDLLLGKRRMEELNPLVTNKPYIDIPPRDLEGWTIVLDPPYQGSSASYNTTFNYAEYWDYVEEVKKYARTLVVFDRNSNLSGKYGDCLLTRKMRVNGGREGDVEAMYIHHSKQVGWIWE